MLQASWDNLLTGLGRGDADIDTLIAEVINSASAYAQNLVPVVGQILESIMDGISKLPGNIISFLDEHGPELAATAQTFFGHIADGIPALVGFVMEELPKLFDYTAEMVPQLVQWAAEKLPEIMTSVMGFLQEYGPQMAQAGLDLFGSLFDLGGDFLSMASQKVPEILQDIFLYLADAIPDFVSMGVDLFSSLIDNASEIAANLIAGIPGFLDEVTSWLTGENDLVNAGVTFFSSLVDGLTEITLPAWTGVILKIK